MFSIVIKSVTIIIVCIDENFSVKYTTLTLVGALELCFFGEVGNHQDGQASSLGRAVS